MLEVRLPLNINQTRCCAHCRSLWSLTTSVGCKATLFIKDFSFHDHMRSKLLGKLLGKPLSASCSASFSASLGLCLGGVIRSRGGAHVMCATSHCGRTLEQQGRSGILTNRLCDCSPPRLRSLHHLSVCVGNLDSQAWAHKLLAKCARLVWRRIVDTRIHPRSLFVTCGCDKARARLWRSSGHP